MNVVFLYKEYNEDVPYPCEIVEVYNKRQDALSRLQTSVEVFFELPFDQIETEYALTQEDRFEPDYVCYAKNSSHFYWIVDTLTVV